MIVSLDEIADAPAADQSQTVKFEDVAPPPADFAIDPKDPNSYRPDGTLKGPGFLGQLPTTDGKTATEKSIGVQIDGKETLIPSLVPGLTGSELRTVLSDDVSVKDWPESISQKAADHAKERIKQGLSPFYDPSESVPRTVKLSDIASTVKSEDVPFVPAKGVRYSWSLPLARTIDKVVSSIPGAPEGQEHFLENLVAGSTEEYKPPIPRIAQQEGAGAQLAAGAGNIPIDVANFFLSPEGLAAAEGFGVLPKVARTAAGLTFGEEAIRHGIAAPTAQEKLTGIGTGLIVGALSGRGAVEEPVPFKAAPEGFEVSTKGVTEPPDVPAYAKTFYDNPAAVKVLGAINDLLSQPQEKAAAPEVQREATGPVVETAAEKATRRTGEPANTAAELAMEQVEPATAETLVTKLATARKALLNESQQLQAQVNAQTLSGQKPDRAAKARIAAINQELAMPTVGVPVEPNTPVETVLKAQGIVPPTLPSILIRRASSGQPTYVRLLDGSEKRVTQFEPITLDGDIVLADGNTASPDAVSHILDENKKPIITPSEVTTAVAVSPASTTPGDVIPGQAAPQPPGAVGVGAGQGGGLPGAGGGAPVVGGLARSTIEDQINAGILPPEALVIGKGWNAAEAAAEGDRLINKGVNPDDILEAFRGKRYMPVDPDTGKRMDYGSGVAVLESEARRFAAERAAAHNRFGPGSPQALAAEAVENNYLRNTRPKAGSLAQRIMVGFQDTTPVDLSKYDDMYKKAAQLAAPAGMDIPLGQKIEMMRKTGKAKEMLDQVDTSKTKRQKIVDETLPRVKTPTRADMQTLVKEMADRLTPCK